MPITFITQFFDISSIKWISCATDYFRHHQKYGLRFPNQDLSNFKTDNYLDKKIRAHRIKKIQGKFGYLQYP